MVIPAIHTVKASTVSYRRTTAHSTLSSCTGRPTLHLSSTTLQGTADHWLN